MVEKHELGGALVVDAERRVDLLQHVAVPRQQLHCAAHIVIAVIAISSFFSSWPGHHGQTSPAARCR